MAADQPPARPLWPALARTDAPEWLDQGHGAPADVAANLAEMWRLNRYLGGLAALTRHLYPRLRAHAGPATLLDNSLNGVKLNHLRKGPFDKQGAGSRILDKRAQVRPEELERLKAYASQKTTAGGGRELGLDAADIERMMDANYARAEGARRVIDRQIMNGEWPVLLDVMGKDGANGRYLSLREIRGLFEERRLPTRMGKRLRRRD